ncbi:LacI family DNA-binding transcriptional regulator [Labedella endophytica]|uniref:LacI family transcriptional regulator n=1 Tax=Labedella endophytica TaxID=1523160 RepID=A0A3S0VE32_9MICO|nr:LacI family DNA-binding transcriptional regulator [Labedella endophytica]RUQ98192.1 LacI family transcriptional regulator [Labedella endophytica]
MTTARDVAQRAGTSTAVVSYVVNNGPRNVSPATRERVLQAARELDYRPNALARALSHGRTSSVGLVVPDIANRFFGELARALEEAAAAHGDLLLIGDSGLDPERERSTITAFVDRRVDAVVLVSVHDTPDLEPLQQAGIPVVLLHPVPDSVPASSISIDYEEAAYAAATHLVEHGYTSIALLNGPADAAGSRQHRNGVHRATDAAGVAITEVSSGIARAQAAQVMLDLLARPDHPRAVYCATDEQAYGVLFACHRLGLSVPEQVAVTGFDGTEHSAYSLPPLTTVRQPIHDIARRALDMVRGGESAGSRHETVGFELVVRESCGAHAER